MDALTFYLLANPFEPVVIERRPTGSRYRKVIEEYHTAEQVTGFRHNGWLQDDGLLGAL